MNHNHEKDLFITLAEGNGGRETWQLVEKIFLSAFKKNPALRCDGDGAILPCDFKKMVMATDSHVVKPIFFKGGDIGKLALCGTINDIAVMGARPRYITCSVIIEEGFSYRELTRLVQSFASAAQEANVYVVTGDTKVVPKGDCDGIFFNTCGVGFLESDFLPAENLHTGDAVLISGSIAEHGITLYTEREGISLYTPLQSDVQSIWALSEAALRFKGLRVMRDPTRGGLAAVLNEFSRKYDVSFFIDEEKIPLLESVQTICEMLGFEPLQVANEGKLVAVIAAAEADALLQVWRSLPQGRDAAIIGHVSEKENGAKVFLNTLVGGRRVVDDFLGEMLPRIC